VQKTRPDHRDICEHSDEQGGLGCSGPGCVPWRRKWKGYPVSVQLIHTVTKNKIFRQATELIGWQVAVKAVSFFTTAWMVRCMGPTNLGVSGLILATSSASSLFVDLGLDILGTRKIAGAKERSKELIELVVGLRWRIATGLFVLWIFYSIYLLCNGSQFYVAWFIGAFYMFTSALNTTWILQGLEELPAQNRVNCVTSVLAAAAYVVLFRPGMRAGADIAVMTVSNIIGLCLLWKYVRRETGASIIGRFDYVGAKMLLYESRWAFAVVCTVFVYLQLDMILLARFAGFEQAGVYRAAASLLTPVSLLVGISSTLLYPRFVVWLKQNPDRMWHRQKRIALLYLLVGSVATAAMFVIGPPLVTFLFGHRFSASIWPFLVLFASKVEVLIGGVFGWAIMAAGRDKLFVIAGLIAGTFSVCCNIYYIPRYGAIAAAAVNFTSEGIIVLLTMYFSRREYSKALSAQMG
jgi:O-antigen/teichoic acid export membrane protein